MSDIEFTPQAVEETSDAAPYKRGPSRRNFLQLLGGAGLASVALMGCDSEEPDVDDDEVTFDFSSDVGVLNYAYALEQLEAAFYAEAAANPYEGISQVERDYLNALAAHEGAHRDFFAAAIPNFGTPIRNLEVDFSSIDFSSRSSVLATAQLLEDTGVSAYNGAGIYLSSPLLLTIAGKIVSVEARHAAAIRSIFSSNPIAFANLDDLEGFGAVPGNGLDAALPPDEVLAAVANTGLVVTDLAAVNVQ